MGNKVSRPTRRLADKLSEGTKIGVTEKTQINPLPSEELKSRFQAKSMNDYVNRTNIENGIPNIQDNNKTKSSMDTENSNSSESHKNTDILQGKDGFDPQGSLYSAGYLDAINKLGKNIKSNEQKPKMDLNPSAVRQLKKRAALYEKGEQEAKRHISEHEEGGSTASHSEMSMVHPTVLTAIIDALNDPRTKRSTIQKEYSLKPDFLDGVSSRFKVASDTMFDESEQAPQEVKPKETTTFEQLEPNQKDEDFSDRIDQEKLKIFKSRLSLDEFDETDSSNQLKRK